MPLGKGGYSKISLYIDVYMQFMWGFALKKHATGKLMSVNFTSICSKFHPFNALMADGGPEFDNQEVREACEKLGVELRIVAVYLPWVNGLLKGMNRILLG